jgi:hypothetical protein
MEAFLRIKIFNFKGQKELSGFVRFFRQFRDQTDNSGQPQENHKGAGKQKHHEYMRGSQIKRSF